MRFQGLGISWRAGKACMGGPEELSRRNHETFCGLKGGGTAGAARGPPTTEVQAKGSEPSFCRGKHRGGGLAVVVRRWGAEFSE